VTARIAFARAARSLITSAAVIGHLPASDTVPAGNTERSMTRMPSSFIENQCVSVAGGFSDIGRSVGTVARAGRLIEPLTVDLDRVGEARASPVWRDARSYEFMSVVWQKRTVERLRQIEHGGDGAARRSACRANRRWIAA